MKNIARKQQNVKPRNNVIQFPVKPPVSLKDRYSDITEYICDGSDKIEIRLVEEGGELGIEKGDLISVDEYKIPEKGNIVVDKDGFLQMYDSALGTIHGVVTHIIRRMGVAK